MPLRMVVPSNIGPEIWDIGTARPYTSPGPMPKTSIMAVIECVSASWLSMTPFGPPTVPEV